MLDKTVMKLDNAIFFFMVLIVVSCAPRTQNGATGTKPSDTYEARFERIFPTAKYLATGMKLNKSEYVRENMKIVAKSKDRELFMRYNEAVNSAWCRFGAQQTWTDDQYFLASHILFDGPKPENVFMLCDKMRQRGEKCITTNEIVRLCELGNEELAKRGLYRTSSYHIEWKSGVQPAAGEDRLARPGGSSNDKAVSQR
jgi:hypothetical protein